MKHEREMKLEGIGMDSYVQNICSCGWAGAKHYAHNDYQYSNARAEWERHLRRNGVKAP